MQNQDFWKDLGIKIPDSQEVVEDNEFTPVAKALYTMYKSFMDAGFSQEQAWALTFNHWVISIQIGSRK